MEEAKKKKMEYDNKYKKENYDRITLLAPKGFGETLNEHAGKQGMTRNAFMYNVLSAEVKRLEQKETGENNK